MQNPRTIEAKRKLAAAIRRKVAIALNERFDGAVADSKPTPQQEQILRDMLSVPVRYVRAGNQSGKSQTGARECAWIFQETHPFWKRPTAERCPRCGGTTVVPAFESGQRLPNKYECEHGHRWMDWGNERLQLLIAVNTQKQFEQVLWPKLEALLDPSTYTIKRNSTGIETITHNNGNTIVVMTYHNTGDAQEKLQGFVAHWAWVDEMPHSAGIFEEIIRRVASRDGYFIATFSPKVRNVGIRRMVDAAQAPYAKVYRLRMFDNPVYADPEKQKQELAKMQGLPASVIATILDGEWTAGEQSVYQFEYETMVRSPGERYSSGWRHMEVVDPAASGKAGYMLLAEDPTSGHWYIVKAEYILGNVPELIVQEIWDKSAGYNVTHRVSDPHEAWFIKQAGHMGIYYKGVYKKTERKTELIKNFQGALGNWLFVAPWCGDLIEEISTCQWSETAANKIIGSQRFHLLDCAQYGTDNRPEFVPVSTTNNWMQRLLEADDKRVKQEALKAMVIQHGGRIGRRTRIW